MTLADDSLMRAVCLLSGTGTNLQVILENIATGNIPISLNAVISDNPMAKGKPPGLQMTLPGRERMGVRNRKHHRNRRSILPGLPTPSMPLTRAKFVNRILPAIVDVLLQRQ